MLLQVKRSLFRPARTATQCVGALLMCNDFVRLRLCNTHDTRELYYTSTLYTCCYITLFSFIFVYDRESSSFLMYRYIIVSCIVQFKLTLLLWGHCVSKFFHRITFVKVEHIANNHVANLVKVLVILKTSRC